MDPESVQRDADPCHSCYLSDIDIDLELLLPKFNQFFLVHRYVCGKIFVKIRSVVFT